MNFLLPERSVVQFKDAMRRCVNTVGIVATGHVGARIGFTATSFSSLSVAPPSIVVAVNRETRAHERLRRDVMFGLTLLGEGDQEVADLFAGRHGRSGEDRFFDRRWDGDAGAPVLIAAPASFECRVSDAFPTGSHSLVIGIVQAVHLGKSCDTLLYGGGRYRSAAEA